ncbi:MAG: hypothetical protein WCC52_03715 [Nitrosotalea sp.]
MEKKVYLVMLLAVSFLAASLTGYLVISGHQGVHPIASSALATGGLVDSPTPKDVVTVIVHDKNGNLISKQTTNNIITTAGAGFFCIQSGICPTATTILNPAQAFVATGPTYFVQFINSTGANTNEPTASDCAIGSNNNLAGDVAQAGTASAHCITSFGASGQYPTGADNFIATLCVNAVSCSGDLRAAAGTLNTTAISTEATRVFTACTPINNGTAPASGTCVNSLQTSTFTNNISSKLGISGLALYSGTATAVSGVIMVAETQLTTVVLNPGDTIQVTWQITI